MADAAKPTAAGDAAILQTARDQFHTAQTHEDKRRQRQEFDYKFSIGTFTETESFQWNSEDTSLRAGRPQITNNRIGPHVRQVVNQLSDARPAIKVNAVDSGADKRKAEIRQGLFRHIETQSDDDVDAEVAYQICADWQVRSGEGFVRIAQKYLGDGPDQELTIEGVLNRFSVYVDPKAKKFTASDARFLFITDDIDSDEYEARYATRYEKFEAVGLSAYQGLGDHVADWFPKGHVRIAEYFAVESSWKTQAITSRQGKAEPRRLESRHVCWYLINGIEILDRRVLPIPWIPVVRSVGEVVVIDGEIDFRGVTRDAIHPQKMVNYTDSSTAEALAIAPKSSWVATPEQTAGFEDEYETANRVALSVLHYNAHVHNGALLPPPHREMSSPDLSAFVVAGQRAENNLRATLGVVDVDASERHKEQSGKAIIARQRQNDLGNGHFARNQRLMMRQVGRVLNKWVPAIYDAPRAMEIIGADEQRQTVMIHAGPDMAPKPDQVPPGMKPEDIVDLTVGRYDLTMSVGSNQTRREEAVEQIGQIITAKPDLLQVIGDLFFSLMDWPEAQQIAERFKKMLPPQLQDQQGQEPNPQQLQQQMQALQGMAKQLTTELEAKTKFIETEQAKFQAQERIKKLDGDLQIELTKMENATKIRIAEINASVKGYQTEATHAAAHESQALQQNFEATQASLERENAQHEAERSRQHEAEQADRGVDGQIAVNAAKPQPTNGGGA